MIQQPLHFGDVERMGRGRKNLDGIKAERRGLLARIGQPVPIDKRSAFGLRDEGDGDGGFHRLSAHDESVPKRIGQPPLTREYLCKR